MYHKMKQNSSNDFQTPTYAINPLLKYLDKNWFIWECACGKGNLVKALKEKGFHVVATDINHSLCNFRVDFLTNECDFDCIVTNPPFSLKQQFLERCYELKKPFALLLPLTTFETKKRQNLFKKNGIEVIILDKRINFETPSGIGSGSWFATAWFITYGLKIGKQLSFVELLI